MIADSIARELAEEFIEAGQTVLDPFCGTSRTLVAAASRGANGFGIDLNPLAVLVSRAKFAKPRRDELRQLKSLAIKVPYNAGNEPRFEGSRLVDFFSPSVRGQLAALVRLINESELAPDSALIAAAVLSATARESSVCRKGSWKLHRMSSAERRSRRIDARKTFAERMDSVLVLLENSIPPRGRVSVFQGNALDLDAAIARTSMADTYDVVFTSPPYGDSFSTVQYGGISSICLGVISGLRTPRIPALSGSQIDGQCLGGVHSPGRLSQDLTVAKSIWNGPSDSNGYEKVRRFLGDARLASLKLARRVRSGGYVILVVGRRSVCGWRVHFDEFLVNLFVGQGFTHVDTRKRRVVHKWTPWAVNSTGRSSNGSTRRLTMQWEYVVVLRKQ